MRCRRPRRPASPSFASGWDRTRGVPVPAAQGGFAKDGEDRIVLSRLDEALLSRMATTTGGTYVRSVAGDMDLEAIYRDHIRTDMEQARVEGGRKQVWSDRYQWFLAPAVLMLLAGLWIPAPRDLRWTALLLLMILLPVSGHAQPAAEGYKAYEKQDYEAALKHFIDGQLNDPDNPELLYNLGNSYYKNGDYDAAANHFLQSLPKADPGLRPELLYNLGNTAYRRGQLQEAIDYYQESPETESRRHPGPGQSGLRPKAAPAAVVPTRQQRGIIAEGRFGQPGPGPTTAGSERPTATTGPGRPTGRPAARATKPRIFR